MWGSEGWTCTYLKWKAAPYPGDVGCPGAGTRGLKCPFQASRGTVEKCHDARLAVAENGTGRGQVDPEGHRTIGVVTKLVLASV